MPSKLKILLGLMLLSAALNLANGSWFSAIVNVLLALGVLRGNESVRKLLVFFSWLGLIGGAIVTVLAVIASLATGGLGAALLAIVAGAFSVSSAGYTIWCLGQPDVQRWMYDKSMGQG